MAELGNQTKTGGLVILFIIIIVGIALLSNIADSTWESGNTYTTTNNSIDISSYRLESGNMTDEQEISLAEDFIVRVTTAQTDNETALTLNTDYTIDKKTGKVTLYDTDVFAGYQTGNHTEWSYTHGDMYVQDSISRTLINLINLFFVIGLVLFAVGFIWKNYMSEWM